MDYEYYNHFMEQLGFEKEVDFTSFYLSVREFDLPERVSRIAERVKKRRNLRVKTFSSGPKSSETDSGSQGLSSSFSRMQNVKREGWPKLSTPCSLRCSA